MDIATEEYTICTRYSQVTWSMYNLVRTEDILINRNEFVGVLVNTHLVGHPDKIHLVDYRVDNLRNSHRYNKSLVQRFCELHMKINYRAT